MYIVVLSRTVVDSDWRFDNGVIVIFMIIFKTSVPINNSPNKDYTHLCDGSYTTYLYEMTPRLKPFRILLFCVRKYPFSSDMVFQATYKFLTSAKIQMQKIHQQKRIGYTFLYYKSVNTVFVFQVYLL